MLGLAERHRAVELCGRVRWKTVGGVKGKLPKNLPRYSPVVDRAKRTHVEDMNLAAKGVGITLQAVELRDLDDLDSSL